MRFEKPARLPLLEIEGVPSETEERWQAQGLPIGTSAVDYLGLDKVEWLHLDFYPVPRFTAKVLEEDTEYRIERIGQGIKTQVSKLYPNLVYQHLEYPVKNRADWQELKKRYDPSDMRRYPLEWGDDEYADYYNNEHANPVGLLIHPFFFRLGYYSMGMIPFLECFYDDPDLIHDMFGFWSDFTMKLIGDFLKKVHPDFVVIAEDMAHKTAPHIAPEMYRQFWFPHQTKVIDLIKDSGVETLAFWNSGDIRQLLPILVEAGFNCFWPLEDVAGMNGIELRREYGKSIRFVGNIAKEALIAGGDVLKRHVYEKVPALIESGGYIPSIDDQIPLEVPFAHYTYYIELLRQIEKELF